MKDEKSSAREPLAIVGMACRFPNADGTDEFWSNILNGVDCITEIPETHWRPEDYFDKDPKSPDMTYAKRGGFLRPVPFEPLSFGIPPASIEATDTSQLLGMVVAREALKDAGYDAGQSFDRDRTGVVLGVTGALELVIPLGARLGHPMWRRVLREAGLDEARVEEVVTKIADGYVPWQEQSFPGLLGNVVAGRIANALDLGGTNCVADAACASALSAVHLAAMELWSGRADMMVTGGVDTFNDIFMYMCFSKTPALSPSGDARPFDANGDGTILGEGIGMVVLKRLGDAERDGDRIYAVLKGMGSSSDGKGNAIYAPSSKGQAKALRRAYEDADVSPETVGLVECHGTGTKVGDATELNGLTDVYREGGAEGTWCALGSVKSQIGHTKAAAGAAGLMKAALALHHKVLPPSIKVDEPLPALKQESPFFLSPVSKPWLPKGEHARRAGVSAFGFGGSNFHAVVEEYQPKKAAVTWDGQVEILAFSGANRDELARQIAGWQPSSDWADTQLACAQSRQSFQADDQCRLLLVLEREKPVSKALERAQSLLKTHADESSWSAPEGITFASGARRGKLGLLFPGQGAQYPDMLRDLACRFPEMQGVLADVDKAFADSGELERLTDLIYPAPNYDDKGDRRARARLRHTQFAQPAIGAVSIGALKVLNSFGITPEAVAGHSYGEITALCASERFDTEALCLLSKLRGKLMAEGEGDRGAMLAVRAELDRVEEIVVEHELDVVLANKNAPDQVVLSGLTSEVEKAAAILDEIGISNKRLSVAAAFHSTLVAKAREPFFAELKKIDFPEASVPVYSNTTALPYPEKPEDARQLLATQLTKPVEFVQEINNMYADGARIFLEVGPGARLTGLVKSILKDREFDALAVDASSGKRPGMVDLAKVLIRLAALGVPLDLQRWEDGAKRLQQPAPTKKGLVISISGANYVSDKTRERAEKPLSKPVKPVVAKAKPQERQASVSNVAPTKAQPAQAARPVDRPQAQNIQRPSTGSVPVMSNSYEAALVNTQAQLSALQKLQTETADLHRRFLEGQETAQQNMRSLIAQQQQLLSGQGSQIQRSIPLPQIDAGVNEQAIPEPTQPMFESTAQVAAPVSQKPAIANASAPVAHQSTSRANIESALLSVVSEKTGYPSDMLALDMQLDGDLGIDSIKRVEIMSALQEALPEAPHVAPDAMGRIERLSDIVALLAESDASADTEMLAASVSGTDISSALLDVVAEKTGYPTDMLNLDMSLDGDLGIDSIKRVEILSGLRDRLPETPEIAPDDLGRFNTLADITAFLSQESVLSASSSAPSTSENVSLASSDTENLRQALLDVVSEKTGYPADMLSPEMSLDSDLGIDSIKRVEIMSAFQEAVPGLPELSPDQMGSLQTLADIIAAFNHGQDVSTTVGHSIGATSVQSVMTVLCDVISDKTGYPVNMLEPAMHLDADLGIDSIKRVEIFSALQEAMPSLPEVKPDELGKFQTLDEIARYFGDASTGSRPIQESVENVPGSALPRHTLMAVVSEKTGYPADMLEDDMALEGDLGIDSIKRVEILSALQEAVPGLPEIEPDRMGSLQTLADILSFYAKENVGGEKTVSVSVPVNKPSEPVLEENVMRLVIGWREITEPMVKPLCDQAPLWLVGEDIAPELVETLQASHGTVETHAFENVPAVPETLAGLVFVAPAAISSNHLETALLTAGSSADALESGANNGGSVFAVVTSMGGRFGLNETIANPLVGALAGLAKTAAREWPSIRCKAIDMAEETQASSVAKAILAETPLEVGIHAGGFSTPVLEESEVPVSTNPPSALAKGDLVLVTGGARGVTAEAALSLARTYQPTLVLIGRSEFPSKAEPAWLEGVDNEAAIKRAIMTHATSPLKPKELDAQYRAFMADRDMRRNIGRMEAAGAKVIYQQLDATNPADVTQVVNRLIEEHGSVKGLVHGAGVLADRHIREKTSEQFRKVFETKTGGFLSFLEALADQPLKVLVAFSSSTARLGRVGQSDYAMANEALNKIAQTEAKKRPNCRVLSVNWGPWAGGMVTPSLGELFASEGIGLIPLRAGADYLVAELENQDGPVETVILGPNSVLTKDMAVSESDSQAPANRAGEQAFEIRLDLENHPFLRSHVIDGKAVLPMAMTAEWLIYAALHVHPGFRFIGYEDLRVTKGVILEKGEQELRFAAAGLENQGGYFSTLTTVADENGRLLAKARVLLGDRVPSAPDRSLSNPGVDIDHLGEIYGNKLFHGPDFQCIEAVRRMGKDGIVIESARTPSPRKWMKNPLRGSWQSEPLGMDAAFQAMILWSLEHHDAPSLPAYLGSYHQFAKPSAAGTRIAATVTAVSGQMITAEFAFYDRESGALIALAQNYQCVIDAALADAFARNQLPVKA